MLKTHGVFQPLLVSLWECRYRHSFFIKDINNIIHQSSVISLLSSALMSLNVEEEDDSDDTDEDSEDADDTDDLDDMDE